MRTAPTVLTLLLASGCSAVVGDIGGYQPSIEACVENADRTVMRDLQFTLENMNPHVAHTFEIDVAARVSEDPTVPHQLLGRFVLEPLGFALIDLEVENAIPPETATSGELFVEFYADTNANGEIDNPTDTLDRMRDHTWTRPVCSDGVQYFSHIFEFQPINLAPIGGDFRLSLTNIPSELQGTQVEARVVFVGGGPNDGQTVGLYRRAEVASSGEMIVEGIIDLNNSYVVMYGFDVDGDDVPSAGDRYCGVRRDASGETLDVEVDVAAEIAAGACDLSAFDADQVE